MWLELNKWAGERSKEWGQNVAGKDFCRGLQAINKDVGFFSSKRIRPRAIGGFWRTQSVLGFKTIPVVVVLGIDSRLVRLDALRPNWEAIEIV